MTQSNSEDTDRNRTYLVKITGGVLSRPMLLACSGFWTRTGAPALCENKDSTVLAPGAQFLPEVTKIDLWQKSFSYRMPEL